MIWKIVYMAIGYAIGVLAGVLLFRPKSTYKRAFTAAREKFTNWDEGFAEGWNQALEVAERQIIIQLAKNAAEKIAETESNTEEENIDG